MVPLSACIDAFAEAEELKVHLFFFSPNGPIGWTYETQEFMLYENNLKFLRIQFGNNCDSHKMFQWLVRSTRVEAIWAFLW